MKSSKSLYLYGVACYVEKDITLDRFQRATPSLVGSIHHDQLSVYYIMRCYSVGHGTAVRCKPADIWQPLLGGWPWYCSLSVLLKTLWP